MSEQPPNAGPVPAGWYPDAAGKQRYWDGHSWGPEAPAAPEAAIAPPPGSFYPAAAPQKKPLYKRAWFIVLACIVGLFVVLGVVSAVAGAGKDQGDASKATCSDLADQAVSISAKGTDGQPKILKIETTSTVTDNRKTYVKPTGTSEALVLSCKGTGVIWDNPDLHANVLLTLTIDKDGEQYVSYKGQ